MVLSGEILFALESIEQSCAIMPIDKNKRNNEKNIFYDNPKENIKFDDDCKENDENKENENIDLNAFNQPHQWCLFPVQDKPLNLAVGSSERQFRQRFRPRCRLAYAVLFP